ncbi:MAG: methyltransferase domain-containing protein [Firmicutes bacterium]|nr:methyltransferase domain-containing protein [Bacillota bacterium]
MDTMVYLQQKYNLQINHIHLPSQTLQMISVVDLDVLIDRAQCEDELPFWAKLWPAARGLALYLWQAQGIAGLEALELGAGTGLCGIVAALKGAEVMQTDFIPDALLFCQANAALNRANGITYRLADWRDFQLPGRYPLIFGSDILYEPALHAPLVKVIAGKLAPGGRIIIADPGRRTVMGFLDLAEEAGFTWVVEEVVICKEIEKEPSTQNTGITPATITVDILELSRVTDS